MDIDDEHYKKYIKYKTKYLELKEYSGGRLRTRNRGHTRPVGISTPRYQYESNKPLSESSKQPEINDLDRFITLYIQKEKIKWVATSNTKLDISL